MTAAVSTAVCLWAFSAVAGDDAVKERLQSVAKTCMAGEACTGGTQIAQNSARSGEEVYTTKCFSCHNSGIGGAPILGDAAAWAPRIAKGNDVLMNSVMNGLNAMPPKGICMDCSEEELKASLDYMVEKSQ